MADFQPGQILYLEHQRARLYTEVIQVIVERRVCWVRPIALVMIADERPSENQLSENRLPESKATSFPLDPAQLADPNLVILHDLRQGSDLLCPASLFTAALDTDVLPVLATLDSLKTPESGNPSLPIENSRPHSQLQNFVQEIWQAYPEAFQP